MLLGYGIGLPLAVWETTTMISSDFDPILKARNLIHYDFEHMAVGLGHLGLILLFCRRYPHSWLATRIAAVRRMALADSCRPVDVVWAPLLHRWLRVLRPVYQLPVCRRCRHIGMQ